MSIEQATKQDLQADKPDSRGKKLSHLAYLLARLLCCGKGYLVLDDSIKTRRGKKTEGVSSHFDHVTGRQVMGQQVLTLGLATEEASLPLDSQTYISQAKARKLIKPYQDGRSVVGKRYGEATTQSFKAVGQEGDEYMGTAQSKVSCTTTYKAPVPSII